MNVLKYLLIFFMVSNLSAQSYEKTDVYTSIVTTVIGDLNKDSLADMVMVTQDTVAESAPYKLQVFFGLLNGDYKLMVETTKAIGVQFPNGRGWLTGNGFSGVVISKGVLTIENELLRGHFEHKFRFQNGDFELIGFSYGSSDGNGMVSSIDFNLSTGIRIETQEPYNDSDEPVTKKTAKIIIRPLPKLQDFIPFENEYY